MYRQLNLKSPEHLAHRIGVPLSLIESVIADKGKHYHPKPMVTTLGKEPRPIVLIDAVAKPILEKINKLFQTGLDHPPYMHGGLKGKTIHSNARPHIKAEFVLKLDIRKFFPSITPAMVINALAKHCGFSTTTAHVVADLATYEGKLITGSPASTIIASLVIREGTERIYGLVHQRGGQMTVFVDDLTISGGRHLAAVEDTCVLWLEETGVKVNEKKRIRTSGPLASKIITGVDISHGVDAPRGFRRGVQALCHRLDVRAKSGIQPSDNERAVLRGKLNHLRQLNPGMAKLYSKRFRHLLDGSIAVENPEQQMISKDH